MEKFRENEYKILQILNIQNITFNTFCEKFSDFQLRVSESMFSLVSHIVLYLMTGTASSGKKKDVF